MSTSNAMLLKKKTNEIIHRKTELCHHRPQTKAHSNEYENNTHKAEQALPAWRGAVRRSRDTKPPLSYSLAVSAAVLLKLLKKNKVACYYAAAVAEIT